MLHRMLVIENPSPVPVDVRERIDLGAAGERFGRQIRLGPFCRKTIRASKYCNRSMYSNRPSTVQFLVDGVVKEWLVPSNFVQFVKMTVYLSPGGIMSIYGVAPKPFDICWLWGFGFLGRHYAGRPEVPIGQNMISLLEHTRSKRTLSLEHVGLEDVHRRGLCDSVFMSYHRARIVKAGSYKYIRQITDVGMGILGDACCEAKEKYVITIKES